MNSIQLNLLTSVPIACGVCFIAVCIPTRQLATVALTEAIETTTTAAVIMAVKLSSAQT